MNGRSQVLTPVPALPYQARGKERSCEPRSIALAGIPIVIAVRVRRGFACIRQGSNMATLSSRYGLPRFGRLFRRPGVLVAVLILFSSRALAGYTTGVGSVAFGYPMASQPLTCDVAVDNGPASCDIEDRSFPYASLVGSVGTAYLDGQGAHLTSTAEVSLSNYFQVQQLMVNADFWLNDHLAFSGAYPQNAVVALTVTSLGTFSGTSAAGTRFEIGSSSAQSCVITNSGSCTLQGLFSPSAGLDVDLMMDVRSLAGVIGSPPTAVALSSGEYLTYFSALAFYDLSGNALALNFSSSSGIRYPTGSSAAAVPEPEVSLLMLLGLAGMGAAHRRRPRS